MAPTTAGYEVVRDEHIGRDGHGYRRILIRTPWFDSPFDLAGVLRMCRPEAPRGATVFVCEKLTVVATGRTVDDQASRFARYVPEFVLDRFSWTRALPAQSPREARAYVESLAHVVGVPVAIVDIDDRGGRVRAVSPGGLPADDLLRALRDNPMGHGTQSTPIGMVSVSP